MAGLRFTILGCGSSGGVPRIGGHWGDCDPENPRNRRSRCSMLIERTEGTGTTRVLIDTSPDMRAQLLAAGVGSLDAVVYTHSHADHVHGLDDLRQVVFNTGARLPVWADPQTQEALYARFGYAFMQPEGSPYPPILEMKPIRGTFAIDGPGGAIEITPLEVGHGTMDVLGFRIADLAYIPDAVTIPEATWPLLADLQIWVVDALRRKPHPTHAHLDMALDWIGRARPARAVLTNMHVDLDYAALCAELPPHICPAHDGMVLDLSA